MSAASIFRNALEVYAHLCRPVCRGFQILQGELDVLLFLANNQEKNTAVDIHRCSGIKQSMVSVHVESLAQSGYLERQSVPGDRRKVRLVCTEKARPVIEAGQAVQERYLRRVTQGITQEDVEAYKRIKAAVERNLLECRAQMAKGELE